MGFLVRLFLCVLILGVTLYAYVSKHNVLTEARMRVPKLQQELSSIEEENVRLGFAIEKFENPLHLMELARKPEFSHLKHPYTTEIVVVELPKKEGEDRP